MADAQITCTGNATSAPELRYTTSGQAVSNFSCAVNRRRRDAQGQWVDDAPLFLRVTCWGQLAEHVAETVQRGTTLAVQGRLIPTEWTDKATGETRRSVEVVADDVAVSLRWATATVQRRRATAPAQASAPSVEQEPAPL